MPLWTLRRTYAKCRPASSKAGSTNPPLSVVRWMLLLFVEVTVLQRAILHLAIIDSRLKRVPYTLTLCLRYSAFPDGFFVQHGLLRWLENISVRFIFGIVKQWLTDRAQGGFGVLQKRNHVCASGSKWSESLYFLFNGTYLVIQIERAQFQVRILMWHHSVSWEVVGLWA